MNDGYVEAGCVFSYLIAMGLMDKSNWKHNTKELYYPVYFFNAKIKGSISFEVVVINGNHCITKSSVRCLSKRHNFNADDVIGKCIIN